MLLTMVSLVNVAVPLLTKTPAPDVAAGAAVPPLAKSQRLAGGAGVAAGAAVAGGERVAEAELVAVAGEGRAAEGAVGDGQRGVVAAEKTAALGVAAVAADAAVAAVAGGAGAAVAAGPAGDPIAGESIIRQSN